MKLNSKRRLDKNSPENFTCVNIYCLLQRNFLHLQTCENHVDPSLLQENMTKFTPTRRQILSQILLELFELLGLLHCALCTLSLLRHHLLMSRKFYDLNTVI